MTMNDSDRRKLAGAVVRDEIAHQGRTQDWAAERMGMASSSLHGVILGEAAVTPMRLRSIAGTLGLPRRLLTSIVDGDVTEIRFIGADEMRPSQRREVFRGLLRAARATGLVTVPVVVTEKGAAWRVKRYGDGVTDLEYVPPLLTTRQQPRKSLQSPI